MNKLQDAFLNNKAFIGFITAGDPDLNTTKKLILAMEKSGTDIIEVGIPFSDPIAEGDIIREADERALTNGCTTDKIFDMLNEIKDQISVPLVFMTYMNPIYTYGKDRFVKKCKEVGIAGLIIPDVPYEEKGELSNECDKYGVEFIYMIAPTSEERIDMISKDAKGFLYCLTPNTSKKNEIKANVKNIIENTKKFTDVPCAIGLETTTPEQAKEVIKMADGVIVNSGIVKIVEKYGKKSVPEVEKYIKEIKEAIS